jgi:hypothetical protein
MEVALRQNPTSSKRGGMNEQNTVQEGKVWVVEAGGAKNRFARGTRCGLGARARTRYPGIPLYRRGREAAVRCGGGSPPPKGAPPPGRSSKDLFLPVARGGMNGAAAKSSQAATASPVAMRHDSLPVRPSPTSAK